MKVLVIGGAGQAGSIHVKNLLELGCTVGCYDLMKNDNCQRNYNAKESSYDDAIADGFNHVLVALPDNILFRETEKVLLARHTPKAVLIEKPGSLVSDDLQKLVDLAKTKSISFYINYQRSFDPRVAQVTKKLEDLVKDGYNIDYISVHSCDKAQPPQKSHQILNQGCHDYALLLGFLEVLDTKVEPNSMTVHGTTWDTLNDSKFLRIGGFAGKTVFDVKMSRVSSHGTYTKIEIALSKKIDGENMYKPVDIQLQFPLQLDPEASWADTWSASFKESMKSFLKLSKVPHVEADFGVKVLKFAELALEKINHI